MSRQFLNVSQRLVNISHRLVNVSNRILNVSHRILNDNFNFFGKAVQYPGTMSYGFESVTGEEGSVRYLPFNSIYRGYVFGFKTGMPVIRMLRALSLNPAWVHQALSFWQLVALHCRSV